MRSPTFVYPFVALLLLAAPALAAVDLEVSLNSTIQGTFDTPGEVESFRFRATAGTLMKIQVAGKGLDLAMGLADPKSDDAPIAAAAGFSNTGSKISLKNFTLNATGTWVLTVSSDAVGAYKLKIKGKAAKKAGDTVDLQAGGLKNFVLSAPAGSAVSLKAKAGRGSLAEPRFGEFDGAVLTDEGKASGKLHAVKVEGVSGGDMDLELSNIGTEGGEIVVKVKINAPKPAPFQADVRDESLGGGTALSRSVASNTGGSVEIDDPQSEIDGAGVAIDAGAMPADTAISIASAPDLEVPQDKQTSGPAVAFGPSGLTFTKPVEIRLPYDPAGIPAGSTVDDLRVLHVKENGAAETLVPIAVNEQTNELFVEATTFSTFQAFSPKGPPNPAGRRYWAAFYEVELRTDNAGDDSRERVVFTTTGELTLAAAGKTDSQAVLDHREIRWTHDGTDTGTIERASERESIRFVWDYRPGNRAIRGTPSDGGSFDFEVGPGARVMLGGPLAGETGPIGAIRLLVEKPKTVPTPASVAGDFFVFSFSLDASGAGGPLELQTARASGAVTLKANGDLVESQSARVCEFDPGSRTFGCGNEIWNGTNRWSIAGPSRGIYEGAIVVSWTEEGGAREALLLPSADGNLAMGINEGMMLVAVRKSSGHSASSGAGQYRIRGLDVEPRTYFGETGDVGDFAFAGIGGTMEVKSNGQLVVNDSWRDVERDESVSGGVRIESGSDSGNASITIDKSGSFTIPNGGGESTTGAVSADGAFGVAYSAPGDNINEAGLILFLKNP